MAISPEELRRIKTNDLNDELVRISLAGWLHQELRNLHGIDVNTQELFGAITEYIKAIPRGIATAADLIDSGMRPRGWPKDKAP